MTAGAPAADAPAGFVLRGVGDGVSVSRSDAIHRRYVRTGHGQGAPSG